MVATSSTTRQGFTAEVTGVEARRQLRMSVGVVVMLAVGIVSAAFTVGSHPIAAKRDVVSTAPFVTMHAEANPVGARAI
ncbi:hypothetical protein [Lichenibacterium dinghuense]|uniref:hypothetical protein n=1 Tax=Lichenibacterium dinghuense TaxID=2895977 RepID=UPI001F1E0E3A|nr:hypothetical protein [Lichenibacterium sp. 6Y81]